MVRPYAQIHPTQEDIRNAINRSRKQTDHLNLEQWTCPGCLRSKSEIVRFHSDKTWGFTIVRHHDHGVHPIEKKNGRFAVILICEECNKVDAKIKMKGRDIISHKDWSFSVEEISSLIIAKPHSRHQIDIDKGIALAQSIINHHENI